MENAFASLAFTLRDYLLLVYGIFLALTVLVMVLEPLFDRWRNRMHFTRGTTGMSTNAND